MSFSFLSPWALATAGLLLIPILVHLFKPRRVHRTHFSSLRWLRLTPQKLSRRIQWHQVLLFLLRAAFLLLLVMALARPLVSADGAAYRERFIVLDVSHSMSYRPAGQSPPMDRARAIAVELVRRNQPGDRTAILLAGEHTRALTELSPQPEKHLRELEHVEAGLSETNLASALPVVRGLLARPRPGATVEMWFLTDNQQHAWQATPLAADLDDLPMTVHVVDVGAAGPQNGWITRARLLEVAEQQRHRLRVELGCVGDARQERTLHFDGGESALRQSREVVLTPGRATVVDFEVPSDADLARDVLRLNLTPADGLPADDELLVNLDPRNASRVLLIEGAGERGYPQTAIQVLKETIAPASKLTTRTASAVGVAEVQDADVVFLADVPELKADVLTALEERVRSGGGLAILLGEAGKGSFLKEQLYKPAQPSDSLLPGPVLSTQGNGEPLGELTEVQEAHPLLSGLRDPHLGDFSKLRFRRWHAFPAKLAEGTAILAWIARREHQAMAGGAGGADWSAAPAILERTFGAGRVVVLNTGAGERWSNFGALNSYLPFIDRLLSYLGNGRARDSYTIGEVAQVPLARWAPEEKVLVTTPSGQRLAGTVQSLAGGRGVLSFEPAEAGVYRIDRPAESFRIVAQIGRGDSVLTPMDAAALREWWHPLECRIVRGTDLPQVLEAEEGRHALWPWLLLAAGLVLLAEMYLVHRLCPLSGPRLAQNIVGRRGLLRPASSE
jgi:hypothetical protein